MLGLALSLALLGAQARELLDDGREFLLEGRGGSISNRLSNFDLVIMRFMPSAVLR